VSESDDPPDPDDGSASPMDRLFGRFADAARPADAASMTGLGRRYDGVATLGRDADDAEAPDPGLVLPYGSP
jgi:hypothetical protein